ncbi:MAG: hypothetical protein RL095_3787, partial [Verrucomicrobiota bacterium]
MAFLIVKPLTLIESAVLKLGTSHLLLSTDFLPVLAELKFEIRDLSGLQVLKAGASVTGFSYGDLKAGLISLKVEASAAQTSLPSISLQAQAPGLASDWASPLITYKAVNDAPGFTHAGFSIAAGGVVLVDRSMIEAGNEEGSDPGSLQFSAKATHGLFLLNGYASTSFNLADVDAGRVHFKHDGSALAPIINLAVADAYGKSSKTSFTAPLDNLAASLPAPTPALLKVAKPLLIKEAGLASLKAVLPQFEAALLPGLRFTVESIAHAKLQLKIDAKTSRSVSSFDYAQLKAGLISLKHDGAEAAPSLSLKISHSGSDLGSSAIPFLFKAVNDAPVLIGHDLAVNPGDTVKITSGLLFASDEEMNLVAGSSSIVFSASAKNGQFLRAGLVSTRFSVADIENGLVSFRHTGKPGTLASFTVKAADDSGKSSAARTFFTRSAEGDSLTPQIDRNDFIITKGGSLTLGVSQLNAHDGDSSRRDSELLFRVSDLSHGRFTRLGDTVEQFSLEDVKLKRVVFTHDGSDLAPTFSFTLSDPLHKLPLVVGNIHFYPISLSEKTFESVNAETVQLDDSAHAITLAEGNEGSISAGSGYDQLVLEEEAVNSGSIDLGGGDSLIKLDGGNSGSLLAGSGSDNLSLGGSNSGSIDLGNGDNTLNLAGSNTGSGDILAGSGGDELSLGGSNSGSIDLGNGDNKIGLGGDNSGDILVGSGGDELRLDGSNSGSIDLGNGDNEIVLGGDNAGQLRSGSGSDHLDFLGGAANSGSIDLGNGDNLVSWDGSSSLGLIQAGDAFDTLLLLGDATLDQAQLAGLAGFDQIDLNGHHASVQTLPASLSGILVSGDATASLLLQGYTRQDGDTLHDGRIYHTWVNDASPGLSLLVEAAIITDNGVPVFSSPASSSIAESSDPSAPLLTVSASLALLSTPVSYSLAGDDAAAFTLDALTGDLHFNSHADFETQAQYHVDILAHAGNAIGRQSFTLSITDVNEAPSAVVFSNTTTSLTESASTASNVKLADIAVTDDALGTNTLSLSGTDAASFTIVGSSLYLKSGTSLNYESKTSYAVNVVATDAALGASISNSFTLAITDVNEAPTAVVFSNTTTSLAESASTASNVKLADIAVTDDALGSETLSLTGADAASFVIVGSSLYLKSGTSLN